MIGMRLGNRYRLVASLGEGGMGAVFEGVQDSGERVAVKLLHTHLASNPTMLARFRREAQACSTLSHPHIVRVTDFQANPGEPPFIVMELLNGVSLGDFLAKHGAISVQRAAHIGGQVLSALAVAHAKDLVHRDIKPSNIVLCSTPSGEVVKLVDFGVAKLLSDAVKLTGSDAIVGTAYYMAPEQVLSRQVDARTDIYSVGATLYHAVSSSRPFKEFSREAVMSAICNLAPTPLSERCPGIDPRFVAVVERAMAKRPADRFASASEMAQELARWDRPSTGSVPHIVVDLAVSSGQVSTRPTVTSSPFEATHLSPVAIQAAPQIVTSPLVAPPQPQIPPGLPRPGDLLLGKFRIERVVGQGGMGIVYAARHELLDQPIALKLLLAGTQDAVATGRFVSEAKMAARIRSEHVCRVLDVGMLDGGVPYIAMDLLSGTDLGAVLEQRGPLPVAEAVDYVFQALEAVAQAHALKIVHRDLKPANFFLTMQPGGSPVVKVLDFGISKAEFGNTASVTSTGAIVGSPAYMAPEQIKNARLVDARADIWSLGVVLYELLAGDCPFNGETLGQVFANIFSQEPAPFATRRPDVPPLLETIVFRCLQQDRERRFLDVSDLAAALAPFATNDGRHAGRLERIQGALGKGAAASQPILIASHSAPALASARPFAAGTVDPWSDGSSPGSGSPTSAGRKGVSVMVVWVAALLMVGVLVSSGALVWRARGRQSSNGTVAAAGAAAEPVAPPVLTPPAPPVSAEPPRIVVPPAASAAPRASQGAPSASASAPAAPTARPARPGAARPPRPESAEEKFLDKRL